MYKFKADINIIGINPFVFVPEPILNGLFEQAGRERGKIPVRGMVNNVPYKQTLVKYAGEWRLYINTSMLKGSPERIGETLELTIEFDPVDRTLQPHPKLVCALAENRAAQEIFDQLAPSMKQEIIRYIANLKTEESIDRNVIRAVDFLLGKARFIGRDKP